ncbi:MAG: DegV family protein [bacterium]|nr:DegV family protein [bacterium]
MRIVTDSAADLTAAEIQEWNIAIIPLTILFPDGEEVKAEAITPDAFYDRLRAVVPQVPTTSQPSPGAFLELYRAAQDPAGILSIHVSSGLSGTPKTAALAAGQFTAAPVTVIDTLTLSCGERFQVLAAAMAAKKGWSVEQIRERLAQIREATEVIFTLETLDYLARGGRIGRVQALAGSLLQIKPIIRVDSDGKYSTQGRGRTIAQAISAITTHLKGKYGDQRVWGAVMHGKFPEKADALAESLRGQLNMGRLDVLRISPVLGVHTGPGIVGAGVVPLHLFDDLT